jgi:hypothetical protein
MLLSVITNQFIPLKSTSALVILFMVTLIMLGLTLVMNLRRSGRVLPRVRGWRNLPKSGWFLIAAFVSVSIWWLIAATRAPTNYDSGLYHIQAIWYASDFLAIPGLANLYPGFGYSNALNSLTAFASNGPLGSETYRIIGGFFLLLFLEVLLRLVGDRRHSIGSKIVVITLGVFVAPMIWMADYWVTSPTFDAPAAILVFISIVALADSVTSGRVRAVDVIVSLLPLALASSMRQHYWFLFAFVAAILLWKVLQGKFVGASRAFWLSIIASVGLISVMLARDYVLSGWVLYPYKIFFFQCRLGCTRSRSLD